MAVHSSNFNALIGLKGEIWDHQDRIAFSIPPMGRADAIPFVIHSVRESNGQTWCDVQSGDLPIRIAAEICLSYPRLADCIVRAHQHFDELPESGSGRAGRLTLPPHPHPDAEDFLFFRLTTENGVEVALIQKAEDGKRPVGTVTPGMTRINPAAISAECLPNHYEPSMTLGRNAPCPCGSGKKSKKCCMNGRK